MVASFWLLIKNALVMEKLSFGSSYLQEQVRNELLKHKLIRKRVLESEDPQLVVSFMQVAQLLRIPLKEFISLGDRHQKIESVLNCFRKIECELIEVDERLSEYLQGKR